MKKFFDLFDIFARFIKKHEKSIKKGINLLDSAQFTFASALEDAQKANEKFDVIIEKAKTEIAALEETIDKAQSQKEIGDKIQEQLSKFINS